ncbi:hypothetical protein EYS14_02250 [Alteromonadaceae bacterium M269]|nr:hypothetical protein EYS14_02250 [Alteromonadaceae bacterium M269]
MRAINNHVDRRCKTDEKEDIGLESLFPHIPIIKTPTCHGTFMGHFWDIPLRLGWFKTDKVEFDAVAKTQEKANKFSLLGLKRG